MRWRSGELDQRIDIKRETLSGDGIGGEVVTLTDVACGLWAKVAAISGAESERFNKLNATHMLKFVIRYRDDLRDDDRIIWNGHAHNIRVINPESGRNLYLEIVAERGVAL